MELYKDMNKSLTNVIDKAYQQGRTDAFNELTGHQLVLNCSNLQDG